MSAPQLDGKAKGTKRLTPPEPKFWQRYSPHHEFPLSSVSSVCLYVLAGLLVWAVVALAMKQNEDSAPLPIAELPGGGGGNPEGQDKNKGPGDAPLVNDKDVTREVKPDATPSPTPKDVKLNDQTANPLKLPDIQQNPTNRIIDESSQAVAALGNVSAEARKQLFEGLAPSKGQGGSGREGGRGTGIGKVEGSGVGDKKGTVENVRKKRVLRWVMMFNTYDGRDYLTQLRELGAIVAFPEPDGGYLVVRDLHPPVRGKKEELSSIQRIFWVDDKPQSVASLSQALGLLQAPPHFVAFFPEKLEAELLQKELKYRNRSEDEIKETRFKVVRGRGGKYEPVVESQR